MTEAEGLPEGPFCPVCDAELVREALTTETAITLVYTCPEHGLAFVVDPFGS